MCSKSLFHFKKSKCINLFGLGYVQLLTKLSLRCTKMYNFLNFVFQNFPISVAIAFEKEFVSSKFKMLVRSFL